MPKMTHPKLPGVELDATERSVPIREKSGWQVKSEQNPTTEPGQSGDNEGV